MQIREKKLMQEEEKKLESTWVAAGNTTIQRSMTLAKLENECKQKLIEANSRYNQALVSAFTKSQNMIKIYDENYFIFRIRFHKMLI